MSLSRLGEFARVGGGPGWSARRLEARLQEEFEDHLERAAQDIRRPRDDALPTRGAPRAIAFGGVPQTAEACRDVSPHGAGSRRLPGHPLRAARPSEDPGHHRRDDPHGDTRDWREHHALRPAERPHPARATGARSRLARPSGAAHPRWTLHRLLVPMFRQLEESADVRLGHGRVVVGGGRGRQRRVHDCRLLGDHGQCLRRARRPAGPGAPDRAGGCHAGAAGNAAGRRGGAHVLAAPVAR